MRKTHSRRAVFECALLESRQLFSSGSPTHSGNGDNIDVLDVPDLASRPSASKTLYLDFNGHTAIDNWGGWWEFGGKTAAATQAYDIDGDTNSFSYIEKANIEKIWKGVVEKFSPFDINITTNPTALSVGTAATVVIGGDGAWNGKGGGVAIRNGFHGSADPFSVNGENVAWVWDAPDDPTYVAETVAHEAGHMLGLRHVSLNTTTAGEYAPNWIMGAGFRGTVGRWNLTTSSGTITTTNDGNSISSAGNQDDLGVIVGNNGFGYRADDAGNTVGTATNLTTALTNGAVVSSFNGVITPNEGDMFRIVHNGGSFEAEVLAAEFRAMLNPQLTLVLGDGTNIAFSNTETGSDGIGEKISLASLNSGTYYLFVTSEGGYGNIGQYRLNTRGGLTNTTANNSMATATNIGLFGDTTSPLGFAGTGNIAETVAANDPFDYFKLQLPANTRQFFTSLFSPGTSADLTVIADFNGNGLYDFNELQGSTAGGTNVQQLTFNNLAGGTTLYFQVRRLGTGTSNYTLKVSADTAPATLPASTTPATFDPAPLHGGITTYDSIEPNAVDTVDYYRATAEFAGQFTFDAQTQGGDIQFSVGTDTNLNGVLDAGEVLANGDANDDVIALAVTAGQKLLARVTGSVAANYYLFVMADYPTGGNTTGVLTGAFPLTASKAGTFYEYMGILGDFYDTYQVNPSAGLFHAKLTQLSGGAAHRTQIIRDVNANGSVDAGDIVAEGFGDISYNVTTQANYYIRIVPDFGGGEFGSTGNYRLAYWGATSVEPGGQGPVVLGPSNVNSIATGYMAYDPNEPALNDVEDYFQFTLASRTRFDVSINNPLFGLQILTPSFQRVSGVGTFEGEVGAISANLNAGTYLVRAYLGVGESENQTSGGGYTLTYKTASITDNSPPVVLNQGFQYEVKSNGIYFQLDQDVAGTVDVNDVVVTSLESGLIVPISTAHYDADSHTVAYAFTAPILADGHYQATLLAGSVRDVANNSLAADKTFNFHVKTADFDRDGDVDFGDLVILAQNYALPGTFSKGDANYDKQIDFGDLVLLAQNYGTSALGTKSGNFDARPFDFGAAVAEATGVKPTAGVFGQDVSRGVEEKAKGRAHRTPHILA
jgi:hypothetical protein